MPSPASDEDRIYAKIHFLLPRLHQMLAVPQSREEGVQSPQVLWETRASQPNDQQELWDWRPRPWACKTSTYQHTPARSLFPCLGTQLCTEHAGRHGETSKEKAKTFRTRGLTVKPSPSRLSSVAFTCYTSPTTSI